MITNKTEAATEILNRLNRIYFTSPTTVQMILSDAHQIFLPLYEVKKLIDQIQIKTEGVKHE